MNIKCEFSFNPIGNQEIEAFEKTFNFVLPDEYKRFLLCHNGGKTVQRRFETKDETVTSSIMLFLPLCDEHKRNLEGYYKKYNSGKIVPSNFIPIGVDPADSLICLSIKGEDKGAVYYCDLDYLEEDNELKQECMKLVSFSFSEFIHSLYQTDN
ncbi:SMI1/KNR4 family protein [Paenibacillus paeoniae]|uniref:SMI1/KNR4 family protein n=1 Tax=Paenibacillus paeoniae TaxID=2292705 RepID=A0A371PKZ3_9BACL|nr:SMI1/KNR4 family protein [Paenibacillus paeoniae]REK76866.1 SMI1/KNR4 family protein [Paenibacillus paeoniae]